MNDTPEREQAASGHESALYAYLVNGFRNVSDTLDEKYSTLRVDPLLAELAARVASDPESDDVRQALLYALNSREVSGAGETVQYFGHRFKLNWLRAEVDKRYRDATAKVDLRRARYYELMLEAFSDGWEDRDFFPSLDHP
ncbi:hypothetical protein ACFQVC_34055 [Streptomyces monticola]|uniref:Uncharacterized protein n=1 Tax=Streptomyces monticola TaxID=2666263 RepID=A0ABW2JV34_9ACTN